MPALAVAQVTAPNVTAPPRWLVFLHGVLGSGANWRTFARQVALARPDWGALLVDLRLHGESQAFAPPHTVQAAAADVRTTLEGSGMHVAAVLGHSFGGKVAMALARDFACSTNGALEHLFIVDSTPGARPDGRGSSGV